MRALTRCQLASRTFFFAATICAVGIFAHVARGQQEVAWNPAHSDWLHNAPITRETAASYYSSLSESTDKSASCDMDCGCGCNMCPCTYGVVEALVLERNLARTPFPLVVGAATGDPLLTTNDLDFPFSGGLRAYFGHRFRDCWAWEAGYFGVYSANASTSVAGNLSLPGDFSGLNVFFGADRVTLDYTTNINSVEFNLVNCCSAIDSCGCRTTWNSVEWLFGFRYVRIDDDLTIAAQRAEVGGLEEGAYEVNAANDLWGGQLGARLRRCWGLWSVEGTGKAGLFYNNASQSQTVTDFPNFLVRQTSSDDDNLAFLGELNASVIRQITDSWYLRAGYNLIWIDGIALAPNQLDFTLAGTSGIATNSGGTMFLHGANFGVEARW